MRTIIIVILVIVTGCSVKWADNVADKGHSKENINEYKEAMRLYNKAIRFNKESVLAYWRRAGLHYQNEAFSKSIDDLNKAIDIDSSFNSGYLFGDRGNAKEMMGDYHGAIKDFTTAIQLCKIKPNRPSTPRENFFHYRARTYVAIGDTLAAIRDLDSAIFYWDKMARAIWLRAQLKARLKRYQEAIQDYESLPLEDSQARFDYYADDFYYQGVCKFRTGDTTYCKDWIIAAKYNYQPAINDLKKYCKK